MPNQKAKRKLLHPVPTKRRLIPFTESSGEEHFVIADPAMGDPDPDLTEVFQAWCGLFTGDSRPLDHFLVNRLQLRSTVEAQAAFWETVASRSFWRVQSQDRLRYLGSSIREQAARTRKINSRGSLPSSTVTIGKVEEKDMQVSSSAEAVEAHDLLESVYSKAPLTDRDKCLFKLVREGMGVADALKSMGSESYSPWISLRKKLLATLKAIPKK